MNFLWARYDFVYAREAFGVHVSPLHLLIP